MSSFPTFSYSSHQRVIPNDTRGRVIFKIFRTHNVKYNWKALWPLVQILCISRSPSTHFPPPPTFLTFAPLVIYHWTGYKTEFGTCFFFRKECAPSWWNPDLTILLGVHSTPSIRCRRQRRPKSYVLIEHIAPLALEGGIKDFVARA